MFTVPNLWSRLKPFEKCSSGLSEEVLLLNSQSALAKLGFHSCSEGLLQNGVCTIFMSVLNENRTWSIFSAISQRSSASPLFWKYCPWTPFSTLFCNVHRKRWSVDMKSSGTVYSQCFNNLSFPGFPPLCRPFCPFLFKRWCSLLFQASLTPHWWFLIALNHLHLKTWQEHLLHIFACEVLPLILVSHFF